MGISGNLYRGAAFATQYSRNAAPNTQKTKLRRPLDGEAKIPGNPSRTIKTKLSTPATSTARTVGSEIPR